MSQYRPQGKGTHPWIFTQTYTHSPKTVILFIDCNETYANGHAPPPAEGDLLSITDGPSEGLHYSLRLADSSRAHLDETKTFDITPNHSFPIHEVWFDVNRIVHIFRVLTSIQTRLIPQIALDEGGQLSVHTRSCARVHWWSDFLRAIYVLFDVWFTNISLLSQSIWVCCSLLTQCLVNARVYQIFFVKNE